MRRPFFYIKAALFCIVNGIWLLITFLGGNIIVYETTGSKLAYSFCSLLENCLFHWLAGLTLLYCIIKAIIREEENENIRLKELFDRIVKWIRAKIEKAKTSGNMENREDITKAIQDVERSAGVQTGQQKRLFGVKSRQKDEKAPMGGEGNGE